MRLIIVRGCVGLTPFWRGFIDNMLCRRSGTVLTPAYIVEESRWYPLLVQDPALVKHNVGDARPVSPDEHRHVWGVLPVTENFLIAATV